MTGSARPTPRPGLTGRGWALLLLGLALLAVAAALSSRDVLRLAVLLVSVPVLCLALAWAPTSPVRLRRDLQSEPVTVGEQAGVGLELHNPAPWPSRTVLVHEQVGAGLGRSPRFGVTGLAGRSSLAVSYRVQPERRGLHQLGPASLLICDTLGMSRTRVRVPGTEVLLALPPRHRLEGLPDGLSHDGPEQARLVRPGTVGDYDASTRPYRQGDDLRRVHWRTSARRGELMVRQEEPAQERQASVVLDVRASAHRQLGAASSLEWAVSAAASVCEHLADSGFSVRLLVDSGVDDWVAGDDGAGRRRLLERLALVEAGPRTALHDALERVGREPPGHVVVAVLAVVDGPVAQVLARCPGGLALVADAQRWDAPETASGPSAAGALAGDLAGSLAGVRQAGWACAGYAPSTSVPHAWARALADSTVSP